MSPATVDWFEVTGHPHDHKPVCLGVKHPRTGRYGDYLTPLEDTLTACGKTWAENERHVTLIPELATCPECIVRRVFDGDPMKEHRVIAAPGTIQVGCNIKQQIVLLRLSGVIEAGEPANVVHVLDVATAEKIGTDLLQMAKDCKAGAP